MRIRETRRKVAAKQGLISRGRGIPPSSEGREGNLSVRTVRGSGVHLAYKLGSKWYYTKMDNKLREDSIILQKARKPRVPGELSISRGSLYVKRKSSEEAKEILTNKSGAYINASSLVLDSDKAIISSDGAAIHIDAHEVQDSYTETGGTASEFNHIKLEAPTLSASSAGVVTTTASTLYIEGGPSAGTNQTITNSYDIFLGGSSGNIGSTGDLSITSAANIILDAKGGYVTIQDTTPAAALPLLTLKNSHGDGYGASVYFQQDSSSPADGDILITQYFVGNNSADEEISYIHITGIIAEVDDGNEAGQFTIKCYDGNVGSAASERQGFRLLGDGGVVNADIGYGAASLTTIAGDLDINGDAITTAGNVSLDSAGQIVLDTASSGAGAGTLIANAGTTYANFSVHHSGSYLALYENGGASLDDYCAIGTSANGVTIFTTVDAAGTNADLSMDIDGGITLNSSTGVFIAEKAGTEFSATNSSYAGMILGYTVIGLDATPASYAVTNAMLPTHDDHKVSFVFPPSGNVEIMASIYVDTNSGRPLTFGLSTTNNTTGFTSLNARYENHTFLGDETDGSQHTHRWYVSGTSGDSETLWFAAGCTQATRYDLHWGGDSSSVADGSEPYEYQPFVMKATALPTGVYTG